MKLRDYQEHAVQRVFQKIQSDFSTLLVLPTGCGKTVCMAHLVNQWKNQGGQGALLLAHERQLLVQAKNMFHQVTQIRPHLHMGQDRADKYQLKLDQFPIVCASRQTLAGPRAQKEIPAKKFDLLLIDEAHHTVAKQYRAVIQWLKNAQPNLRVVGVTATPFRHDQGPDLSLIFDSVAFEYSILDAIDQGWLVDIEQEFIHVDTLDFSTLKARAGDFSQAELSKILVQEENLHKMIQPLTKRLKNHQALAFCRTVAHAQAFAQVSNRYFLQQHQPPSAIALSGDISQEDRHLPITQFRQGDCQLMVNVGLFLEGFDVPTCDHIVMAAPTLSIGRYTQMMGRGMRVLPGIVDQYSTAAQRKKAIAQSKKPRMTCLDFVGNSGRHKIISSLDILAKQYPQDIRDRALQLALNETSTEPRAICELALLQKQLLESEKKRLHELRLTNTEALRRTPITADHAHLTQHKIDPFNPASPLEPPAPTALKPRGTITDKQIDYILSLAQRAGLEKYKKPWLSTLSKKQAGAIIGELRDLTHARTAS